MVALVTAFWVLTVYPVSLGLIVATMAIIAVMVGALTPDLDQPTANIWRRMIGGNTIGNIFKAFSGGHRHLTHSVIGILLIGWLTHWVALHLISANYTTQALAIWRAFMIGYISHPVADTFTDMGVPWFWPINFKVKIPPGPGEVRVTTNSFVERLVVRTGVVAIAIILLQSHWMALTGLFLTA